MVWIYRCAFAGLPALMLLIGFGATIGDDATLHGLNASLLDTIVKATPTGLNQVLSPLTERLIDGDFGSATAAIHSLVLALLVALAATIFAPHLILAFRAVRARLQRFIDDNAIQQARAASHRLSDGQPGFALKQLRAKYPDLRLPPELEGADAELQLTYTLLALASRVAPRSGMTGALAAIVEGAPGARRTRVFDLNRLAAVAILYVTGCVVYIGVVPLCSTQGPGGPELVLCIPLFCGKIGDWIANNPESIRDLSLQIGQLTLIVVVPLMTGLAAYGCRRRRLPAEARTSAIRSVISNLFWLPFGVSAFFIVLEAFRFHFQPGQGFSAEILPWLLRNVVRDMLMSCIPMMLIWVWTALLESTSSLLMACVVGSLVAALCCTGTEMIFEAMVTAEDSAVQLAFGAHAALLSFYLVCLSGLAALLFVPDALRLQTSSA